MFFRCKCCESLKDENAYLRRLVDRLMGKEAELNPTVVIPEPEKDIEEEDDLSKETYGNP